MWVPELPFQLACQRDNALKGRPMAFLSPTGGNTPCLWIVNRLAKAEGIQMGEAMDQALRRLPNLRVLDPEPQTWWEAQSHLGDFLSQFSPQGMLGHCGEALLELKGTEGLLGPAQDAASRIGRDLQRQVGWVGHGGISGSATAARLASRLEHSVELIREGAESSFLAPFHLRNLQGLSPRIHWRLQRLGLHLLGDLQPLPLPILSCLMPETEARQRLTQAKGEDRLRLPMLAEAPGQSRHAMRLEPPRLSESICVAPWCLEHFWSEGRSPRRIELHWWDVDGQTHRWSPSQEELSLPPLALAPMIEKGFRRLCTRRILIHRLELCVVWGLGQAKGLFDSPHSVKLNRLEPTLAKLRRHYPHIPVLPGWARAKNNEPPMPDARCHHA